MARPSTAPAFGGGRGAREESRCVPSGGTPQLPAPQPAPRAPRARPPAAPGASPRPAPEDPPRKFWPVSEDVPKGTGRVFLYKSMKSGCRAANVAGKNTVNGTLGSQQRASAPGRRTGAA